MPRKVVFVCDNCEKECIGLDNYIDVTYLSSTERLDLYFCSNTCIAKYFAAKSLKEVTT